MMLVVMTDLMAVVHVRLRAQWCKGSEPEGQTQCSKQQFSQFHVFFPVKLKGSMRSTVAYRSTQPGLA